MPFAARILDPTAHPGIIAGPGAPNVLINKLPAACVGDQHGCLFPPPAGPHPPSPIATGSVTVKIGGRAAARVGDVSGCGSPIIMGSVNVTIGG
jgi:uncharacterized Zn-binding protein involved in type VI secretion